jgi:tRNA A-37 threonylcarbamoyl transferase component Bud32
MTEIDYRLQIEKLEFELRESNKKIESQNVDLILITEKLESFINECESLNGDPEFKYSDLYGDDGIIYKVYEIASKAKYPQVEKYYEGESNESETI